MTNKEAVKILKGIRKDLKPMLTAKAGEAFNRAEIALKFNLKRSPRAPKNLTCPTCGESCKSLLKNVDYTKHRVVYCWNCGQAIKTITWKTEETNE